MSVCMEWKMGLGWLSLLTVELETTAGILICGAVSGGSGA